MVSDFQRSQTLRDLRALLMLGAPIEIVDPTNSSVTIEALARAIYLLEKLPRFLRELRDPNDVR